MRLKSNGNITIRGREEDVLDMKETFDIIAPKLQGHLEEIHDMKPFGGGSKRNHEGTSIDIPAPVDNRELIRNFKKGLIPHSRLTEK